MTEFIDNHTYCACGEKVKPGEYHKCIVFEPSYVPTNKYQCVYCKSFMTPIKGNGTTTCGSCGRTLHGAISNPNFTVVHRPGTTQSSPSYSWPSSISTELSFMNSGRGFENSSYYTSNSGNMYNPVRNSSSFDSGNAWHNISAHVYDITH